MNLIQKEFRFLPLNTHFLYNNIEYVKTNFQRGYNIVNGKKEFLKFKAHTIVETNSKYFEL